MRPEERVGLERFLSQYPGMRIQPSRSKLIHLEGQFEFRADSAKGPIIEDAFQLRIILPNAYPKELPKFFELGTRIPREADHHVFPEDGALCLGSPLRLEIIAQSVKDFTAFVQQTLVPFLYAVSHSEKTGKSFLFGELKHGLPGLVEDYRELLQLQSHRQIVNALSLLAMKKRLANKRPCPCDCGSRLGSCSFNGTIRQLRARFGRMIFKRQLSLIDHYSSES